MSSLNKLTAIRDFYNTGATKSFEFRKQQLQKLQEALANYEQEIYKALFEDLKKSPEECWVTENGFVVADISNTIKHLHKWMQPERVKTNLLNLPSKSFILAEPLGVVCIIAPWNYPLQLL
ncbi:MAG: aldehyde dehydrogenase family protein, partial [Ferruginibacter sp.]